MVNLYRRSVFLVLLEKVRRIKLLKVNLNHLVVVVEVVVVAEVVVDAVDVVVVVVSLVKELKEEKKEMLNQKERKEYLIVQDLNQKLFKPEIFLKVFLQDMLNGSATEKDLVLLQKTKLKEKTFLFTILQSLLKDLKVSD